MAKNIAVEKQLLKVRDRLEEMKFALVEEFSDPNLDQEKIRQNTLQLIELLIEGFTEEESDVLAKMTRTGRESGNYAQEMGYTLDASIYLLSNNRRAMWKKFKDILREIEADVETVFEVAEIFDPIYDRFIYTFSMAYIEAYEKSLERAEDEFLELSAPVVPVAKDAAVVPVIGRVDEKRSEVLLECVLREAVARQLSFIFIDLTGVSVIDTMVASHIFKIVQSLELVGVTAVLVGIRPEISQTMVSLGVNFEGIKTYHSLLQAFTREKIFANS